MKRILLCVALLVYVITLFSGCGADQGDSAPTTMPTTAPTQPTEKVTDSLAIAEEELQILNNIEIIKVFEMDLVSYGRCQPATVDQTLERLVDRWDRYIIIENGRVCFYKEIVPGTQEVRYNTEWDHMRTWHAFYVYAKEPDKYFDFPYTIQNVYCCDDGRSIALIYYVTEQGNYVLYTNKYEGGMYLIPEEIFQRIAELGVEKLDSLPEDYVGYYPTPESLWDLTPYKVETKE